MTAAGPSLDAEKRGDTDMSAENLQTAGDDTADPLIAKMSGVIDALREAHDLATDSRDPWSARQIWTLVVAAADIVDRRAWKASGAGGANPND